MATSKVSSFHLDAMVVELAALEDIALEFVNSTAQSMDAGAASAFRSKCETLIKEGQLQTLVETFVDALEKVGAAGSLQDTESRFAILFSLARHLPADVLSQSVVPRISKVVVGLPSKDAGQKEQDDSMRIGILRNLYSVLDARAPARFGTLTAMVEFALKSQAFTILDGTSALDIEELCSLWGGSSEEVVNRKRKLHRSFADLCEAKARTGLSPDELRSTELKQQRFLTKLLESYEGGAIDADVLPYAARAALIAVKYPLPGDMAESNTLEEHSLTGMKRAAAAVLAAEQTAKVDWSSLTASASAIAQFSAIKALADSGSHKVLFQLLSIFAAEGLDEFQSFAKANPTAINDLGLSEDACLKNIRFLTLASLAANSETVSYTTIASKLQVDSAEVETWVIEGITCKVIDAKMDQLNQTIVINRGSQRLLTDRQWEDVHAKLVSWKENVGSLLATIKSVRQEQLLLAQQQ
mmetsp:Transcript_21107/g.67276  ORF Transcript_21107/g.67276 Transcript_21107/m.67276 type:complete len:470 (+) Transcript_21107:152-1561(+)